MIRGILSLYRPSYVHALAYMLQSTEYHAGPYLAWYWRTRNFSTVMHRRTLEPTRAANLLARALIIGLIGQNLLGVIVVLASLNKDFFEGVFCGIALIVSAPVVWAHLIVIPLWFGRTFIIKPKERKLVAESKAIFAKHPGTVIAVAGSYGKTSMKEMLATVLGEGLKVAATPANKNVAVSHAAFARGLKGDEQVLIIEYGEGEPGDVQRFSDTTQPDIAVITGLAPAHLDQYKTVNAAGEDIMSVAAYLKDKNVYVNAESPDLESFIKPEHTKYSQKGVGDWIASSVLIGFDGTKFHLRSARHTLNLHSALLGKHQVGPLALAAKLAMDLGMSPEKIAAGIAKTVPYDHRMQARAIHGAWVIDDTYNGNIEGVRVGLKLLKELPAETRVYVTPGLVDQGAETEKVHKRLGEMIAEAAPDVVVLMKNSVTPFVEAGMQKGNFKGELVIEPEPLKFYTNLDLFVAKGDVVLMQNDWTDNYS